MDIDNAMRELWGDTPSQLPPFCAYAQQYNEWAKALIATVEHECTSSTTGLIAVYKAKVSLLDKYFDWRNFVPRSHRYRLSSNGHRCLYSVLEDAYNRLRLIELSLTPPPLAPGPPPPFRVPKTLSIADIVSLGPVSTTNDQ